jgi:hypothetical protein
MSETADQVSDLARFAAREFVAQFARETGAELSAIVTDRMLFAFEVGYMRGRGDGMLAATAMYDAVRRKIDDEPK